VGLHASLDKRPSFLQFFIGDRIHVSFEAHAGFNTTEVELDSGRVNTKLTAQPFSVLLRKKQRNVCYLAE
jgi:hypothetical protein